MGHNARQGSPHGFRRILTYGILLFQVILIGSLIRGVQISYKSRDRITDLEAQRQALEERKAALLQQQAYVQSDYYLEKVARDELHLSKPGEQVVILPDKPGGYPSPSPQGAGRGTPIWRQWWQVLWGVGE